jgi:predicted nucleotidyltransferase
MDSVCQNIQSERGGVIVDFEGRKVVFKALVGSHNYNLNDENSDKDYKYFVLPTFDDLYHGKMFSTSKVSPTEDYSVHDIRKLGDLLWKANLNFLEVLYSKETEIFMLGEHCRFKHYPDAVDWIFENRDKLVTMNLPYLYNACKGMHFEKMKRLNQASEGTQHLLDKYGYNTKEALHAYRVLDFCDRFATNEFTSFDKAIYYDYPPNRAFLMGIKHGEFSESEFRVLMDSILTYRFARLENVYKAQKPDIALKEELDEIIKDLVKENIR